MGEEQSNNRASSDDPAEVVSAGERLTIDTVAALHQELQHVNDTGKNLLLDVSGVATVDTAGVQLLYVHAQEAVRTGRSFIIQGCCAVLSNAVAALGMQETLAHHLEPGGCEP